MTIQELEQCILDYGKDIYNFCLHLTRCKEEADELYQDTFLKATEQMIQENPKDCVNLWDSLQNNSSLFIHTGACHAPVSFHQKTLPTFSF